MLMRVRFPLPAPSLSVLLAAAVVLEVGNRPMISTAHRNRCGSSTLILARAYNITQLQDGATPHGGLKRVQTILFAPETQLDLILCSV